MRSAGDLISAFEKLDASSGEEVAHPVVAGTPVDVALVVGLRVRRFERHARPGRLAVQDRVERLLPRGGMHCRGLGQDAVEVKPPGCVPAKIHRTVRLIGWGLSAHDLAPGVLVAVWVLRRGGWRPAGWVGGGALDTTVSAAGVLQRTRSLPDTVIACPKWSSSSASPSVSQ